MLSFSICTYGPRGVSRFDVGSHRELLNFVVETFSVCTDTIDQPSTEYDTPVHDLEGIPEPPGELGNSPQ
jgi:hypothetical protein